MVLSVHNGIIFFIMFVVGKDLIRYELGKVPKIFTGKFCWSFNESKQIESFLSFNCQQTNLFQF